MKIKTTLRTILIALPCVGILLAQNPETSRDKHPSTTHQWLGRFTSAEKFQTIVHREDGFYIKSSNDGQQPADELFLGTPQGLVFDDDALLVGDFAKQGTDSFAVFDESRQQWYHGKVTGSYLNWEPVGNGRVFQAVEFGAVIMAPQPGERSNAPEQGAELTNVKKAEAVSGAAPMHTWRTDPVPCGVIRTDFYLYPNGIVDGTISLSSVCLANGTHASMSAVLTDAAGKPVYSTPSLRLGVNPMQSVLFRLNDPKYAMNVPANLMGSIHGIAIMQKYDPNELQKDVLGVFLGVSSSVTLLFFLLVLFVVIL